MKKIVILLLSLCLIFGTQTGCGIEETAGFEAHKEIHVISREDGSGTRGAFTELLGLIASSETYERKDLTTKEAVITKQTDVMLSNVSSDLYAVGYSSLGTLNDSVKVVAIDGVYPNTETIKNGEYAIARPFLLATLPEPTPLVVDFLAFTLSREGQAVISASYISVDDAALPYTNIYLEGKLVISGSSSVSPIMEKLREAYMGFHPEVTVEIQQSDSSSGLTGLTDNTCDIAMSSRALTEKEAAHLVPVQIASDGIVIIVNLENPLSDITKAQARDIFTGEISRWSDIKS